MFQHRNDPNDDVDFDITVHEHYDGAVADPTHFDEIRESEEPLTQDALCPLASRPESPKDCDLIQPGMPRPLDMAFTLAELQRVAY